MRKYTIPISAVLLMVGCSGTYNLPDVDSGSVEVHAGSGAFDHPHLANLSPTQIRDLSTWFYNHRTGWERVIADTAPGTFVYLKHGATNAAYVNIQGHYVYSADKRRALTDKEREAILAILSAN